MWSENNPFFVPEAETTPTNFSGSATEIGQVQIKPESPPSVVLKKGMEDTNLNQSIHSLNSVQLNDKESEDIEQNEPQPTFDV